MKDDRRFLWPFVGILLLAFALRVYRLNGQSVWYDEGLSIFYARQGLSQLLAYTSASDHPPLYFVLLHIWLRLVGTTEFSVRYFSLIWSVLLLPVMYVLGGRLLVPYDRGAGSGSWARLAALLFLAVSPFHVWYAQEVRMYTLVVFLNTAASVALLSALGHDQRRSWLAYVLLCVAGLYAHFYTVFVLIFHAAFALWLAVRMRRRQSIVHAVLAQATAGAAFLPWGPFLMEQIQTNDTYWRGTLALRRVIAWLLRAFAVGEAYSGPLTTLSTLIYILLALVGGLMLIRRAWWLANRGLRSDSARDASHDSRVGSASDAIDAVSYAGFLHLYILVPTICLLVLSYSRPKFAPRYLLSVTPAYYFLAGYGLTSLLPGFRAYGSLIHPKNIVSSWSGAFRRVWALPRGLCVPRPAKASTPADSIGDLGGLPRLLQAWRWGHRSLLRLIQSAVGIVFLVIIVITSTRSLWAYYTDLSYGKPDFRAVGHYIAAHAEEGDGVVIVAGHAWPAFEYYNERGLATYPVPDRLLPTVSQPVDRQLMAETLDRAVVDGHSRLWLVLWQEELADPMRLVLHNLAREGRRLGVTEAFHGVALLLFEIPPGTWFPIEPPISHALTVNFDDRLELVGYDLDSAHARPGATVHLTLYWRVLRPLAKDYTAFTQLLGPENRMLGQEDHELGRGYYPTSRWPVGKIFEEVFPITVHAEAPPGRYPLWVGLYLRRTMKRLPIVGQESGPRTEFLLTHIDIEP